MKYVNYKRYSVEYDEYTHLFTCFDDKMGRFLSGGCIAGIGCGGSEIKLSDFEDVVLDAEDILDGIKLILHYIKGPDILPGFDIEFIIDKDTIRLVICSNEQVDITIKGNLYWGSDPEKSTYAVCLEGRNSLRAANGPAASKLDNALYDRLTDSIAEITGYDKIGLKFDWDNTCFGFKINTRGKDCFQVFQFRIYQNYYAEKFSVPFKAINKGHQFPTPPVGWMTWYSVQFDASSKTVLENAKWLSDNLKEYGANCIWVDWEWYHSDMSGTEAPGVDTFNPKKESYPEGLKYISDEIRKLGLLPALWIGATNDTNKNELLLENPEWVLANHTGWCGQWWIDPSNPEVVSNYIPTVFRQLLDWGYEVFKWDCLPFSLYVFDIYHNKFYNTDISSEKALRNVVMAAREVIGENRYMMSCSGNFTRDIMFAADYFDGARIGLDIFKWDEFVAQCIDRALKYYMYHNVMWYADMDNLILRSEFNNMEQARSRVSFYTLTGVPITLGDYLPDIDMERVELIKRALPVVDIHPMNIYEIKRDSPYVLVNLNVAKSFGNWNVIDVINTTGEEMDVFLDFDRDLNLDMGNGEAYTVYDFWKNEFLGIHSEVLNLTIPPYGSRVISINKLVGSPQVISTSRHVTQGAYDLEYIHWDALKRILSGKSRVIGGEAYRIILYVPKGFELINAAANPNTSVNVHRCVDEIWMFTLMPSESYVEEWAVEFKY